MELKHNEIENKNIIENYVLGRLDEEDELAFEEHILNCAECRQKCVHLQKIIEASESNLIAENNIAHTTDNKKLKSVQRYTILLGTAAALILLLGTVFLIYNTRKLSNIAIIKESVFDSIKISANNNTLDISDTLQAEKEEIPEEKPQNKHSENQQKLLIAEAYNTNPIFESAIEDQLRSNGISVDSPVNSAIYSRNQEIKFVWQTDAVLEPILLIRNNSGKTLFKENVQSAYVHKIDSLGLYYWQLMDNDEIIYTGKFLVK